MPLTRSQKTYLRGLTHQLSPVVAVADKGLTDNVMQELEIALDHHELIKVKLRLDREQRDTAVETILQRCKAELVQQIGQTASFYRRNRKEPKLELPKT